MNVFIIDAVNIWAMHNLQNTGNLILKAFFLSSIMHLFYTVLFDLKLNVNYSIFFG